MTGIRFGSATRFRRLAGGWADRIEVNADRLVMASHLWSPFTLLVTAPDGVTGTMETGPGRDTLSFASQGGGAVLEIGETTIRSGTVALTSATVTRLAAPDAPVADIGSVEVMLEPKRTSSAGPAQTVAVSASDLRISEAIRVPFEGPASLSARATMSGPFAGLHPDQIAIWREAGGVLDVHRLDLNWSPLNLRADGTLGLDGEYRPEGGVDHICRRTAGNSGACRRSWRDKAQKCRAPIARAAGLVENPAGGWSSQGRSTAYGSERPDLFGPGPDRSDRLRPPLTASGRLANIHLTLRKGLAQSLSEGPHPSPDRATRAQSASPRPSGYGFSCRASITSRRTSRVRSNRPNSLFPSPQRIARWR